MKVTPSQIEFTLPSPKLGTETSPVVDPPWEPRYKTKMYNAVQERGQVRPKKALCIYFFKKSMSLWQRDVAKMYCTFGSMWIL